MADPARAQAVRAHARLREREKYGPGRPSSEDVWQSRDELVAPGSFFSVPYDPPAITDNEWRKMEVEKRRQMRDELGFDRDPKLEKPGAGKS